MSQAKPKASTVLDLTNEKLVRASDIPTEGGDEWGQVARDYDKAKYDYNWNTEWIPQTKEGGEQHYDFSDLQEGDILRFNDDNSSRPALFGVTEKSDSEVQLDKVTATKAIRVTKGEDSLKTASSGSSASTSSASSASTSTSTSTSSTSNNASTSNTASPNISRKDRELPVKSSIVGDEDFERGDVVEEFEGTKVFGYMLMYTTGTRLLVPREKLLEKMEELGIPTWMAPRAVKPYRAFPRACDALLEDGYNELKTEGKYEVNLSVEKNGSRYKKMLVASKQIPDDESETDDSDLEHINVARINYDKENKEIVTTVHPDAEGDILEDIWEATYKPRLQEKFEKRQLQHNGKDLNEVISSFVTNWSDSTRIRDACYFVPAFYRGLQDTLSAFDELYTWLDENYKKKGQKTEIHYLGVTDNEQHKGMVESAIEDEIEGRISDLFDEIIEEMVEKDDLAEDIAETVVDETGEMENLAERYSRISSTQINIKKMMKDYLSDLENEKKSVVSEVLDEADI